ncbi:MAG: transglycosylase SLT domain-containing protein [Pseudomonadota bacterium]
MKVAAALTIAVSLAGPAVADHTVAQSATTSTAVHLASIGEPLPRTRWDHVRNSDAWTRATLSALATHGQALPAMVPADIDDWCPAYSEAEAEQRRAFWVGFLSTLTKHESTHRPTAVGGGGRWFGLTQIAPSTARLYGCKARNGTALKNAEDNLSCAVRIMSKTVPRDGVVSRGMRGVAADWGPLHSSRKRNDMKAWVQEQGYCQAVEPVLRPQARDFAKKVTGDKRK